MVINARKIRAMTSGSALRSWQWRGVAPRYEKRAVNYLAMLALASIVLWLEPW